MSLRRTIPFLCVAAAGVVALVSFASSSLIGQARAPTGTQFPAAYREIGRAHV